jgi:predicted acyltransferase
MKNIIGEDKRLVSLDLFRGITMAAMILVNNQGNWSAVYPAFRHAAWDGWLGADIVFPFFLFAVGASIHLSCTSLLATGITRKALLMKVVRRTVILTALGLFLNLFPFFNFGTVRIPGVLQRIGLCYCFASFIYLYTGERMRIGITMALLMVYGILLLWVTPDGFGRASLAPCCNLPGFIDGALFPGHTYEHAPVPGFDPEGILSTIPAIASAMVGVCAARLLQAAMAGDVSRWLVPCTGLLLMAAGLALDLIIPINKNLWTPSYVLFMGGLAVLVFFLCHYLRDIRRYRLPAMPFLVLGRNALAVYLFSSLAGRAMISFYITDRGAPISVKNFIFTHAFAPWFDPSAASLLYATMFLLFWWAIMYLLYRKNIFISL